MKALICFLFSCNSFAIGETESMRVRVLICMADCITVKYCLQVLLAAGRENRERRLQQQNSLGKKRRKSARHHQLLLLPSQSQILFYINLRATMKNYNCSFKKIKSQIKVDSNIYCLIIVVQHTYWTVHHQVFLFSSVLSSSIDLSTGEWINLCNRIKETCIQILYFL